MKLEDEIKQTKPFKSELQKLILNISFTGNWFNSILASFLKPYGITPHQFNVLRILKGRYPESYCNYEITLRMLDKSSNATRIVDKLIDKSLAIRSENSVDRRQVNIVISEKGLLLLDVMEKEMVKNGLGIKPFNEEKSKLMNEWLDELRG